jgi:hypothetical protein
VARGLTGGDPSKLERTERVDLIRAETEELTRAVVGLDRAEPFGVYLFGATDPGSGLARAVERDVFWETFGNTPELLQQEYGPYDAASIFFCVVDHRRRIPVGMMRVIVPSAAGLKSLNDIATAWGQDPALAQARTGVSLPAATTWDVATLAVRKDYRGTAARGLVSLALYQRLNMAILRFGVTHLVAILDTKVLRVLQLQLHNMFHPFAGVEPQPYLDSPVSLPVWCDVRDHAVRLAAVDRVIYNILFDGEGLADAVAAPDWQPVDSALAGLRGRL